jgi:hypothetical protein
MGKKDKIHKIIKGEGKVRKVIKDTGKIRKVRL